MDQEKLQAILDNHKKWLEDNSNGVRANLIGANLKNANLRNANFYNANLRNADLRNANLINANLIDADLSGSNLSGSNLIKTSLINANLRNANLRNANLKNVNLFGAILIGAYLSGSNLYYTNLNGANLCDATLCNATLCNADLIDANLCNADLSGTCLDANNQPNAMCDAFSFGPDGLLRAYRTRKAGHIDQYRDNRYYSADWFSTADTECHPGLYIWPTVELARNWSADGELIEVSVRKEDVHKAGPKWRCRQFYVVGTANF